MLQSLIAAVIILGAVVVGVAHSDPILDTLVSSYPDQLAGYENGYLLWKDGTEWRFPIIGLKRPLSNCLTPPDILDQFAIRYPLGTPTAIPGVNEDPGRIRNEAFFRKMYGDCQKGEVRANSARYPGCRIEAEEPC
jgi:hypothetical protein